jgi:hypothetical protein
MNLGLNMENRTVSEFPTKDIYLAAAVKAKGARLLRCDPVGKRAIFVFENTPALKDAVAMYMNRELIGEAHDLFEAWKSLKSLVFSVLEDVR